MVAIAVILGFIATLAGAMTGKWFLVLIGLFLIIIPFMGGVLLFGNMPWWVVFGIIIIFIYLMDGKGK